MADTEALETEEIPTPEELGMGDEPEAPSTDEQYGDPAKYQDPEVETKPVPTEEAEEDSTPSQQTVPLSALHEERERRKEFQQKLDEQAAHIKLMEERFAQFQKAQEPEGPSYDENPAEYLKSQVEALRKQQETVQQTEQERIAQQQQAQQYQAFRQSVEADEASFRAKTPDYDNAVQHLQQARIREWAATGMPQHQAQMLVLNEAHAIAKHARDNNVSPAQAFYTLAKERGYRAATTPEATKLQQVAQQVQKSTSLGPTGSGDGDVTLSKLAQMDEEEFMAATSGNKWSKVWGG